MTFSRIKNLTSKNLPKISEAFTIVINLTPSNAWLEGVSLRPWRSPSNRSQSIDLLYKSCYWPLYDRSLRHERVKFWNQLIFQVALRGVIESIMLNLSFCYEKRVLSLQVASHRYLGNIVSVSTEKSDENAFLTLNNILEKGGYSVVVNTCSLSGL